MKIAEQFADFTSSLSFHQLPESVVEKTKLLFLDWLGATLQGSKEATTTIALEVAGDLKGPDEATVLADMSQNSCLMAALVNGVGSHALELDDLHRKGIYHPGGPVFPAILAVAEKLNLSGTKFIEAAVVGYEIGIRSAVAAGSSHYKFWHTTGTCGTFGAAAATAKLLSLDKAQTSWALGSAGTQAAGLWEFLADSTMSKQLHPAKAAVNGMLAAFLARRGFTGAGEIYEGKKGFLRATSGDYDLAAATENIGTGHFKILETTIKKHASCGHTHSAIDCILNIVNENNINCHQIDRIDVQLCAQSLDLIGEVVPSNSASAKFSIPFCIAAAAILGKVDLGSFEPAQLHDQQILKLMGCVSLQSSPELTVLFPEKSCCIISIKTKSGEVFSDRVNDPLGTPENPMSNNDVLSKFEMIPSSHMKFKHDFIIEKIMQLEKTESMNTFFKF